MSILIEKEIAHIAGAESRNVMEFARAIESAVLAKLAGMELPEPYGHDVYVEEADNGYIVYSLDDPQLVDDATNHGATTTALYTAAQLHQAFAQGAASQLMARPSGWRCQSRKYPNQCCIAMNEQTSDDATEVTPLYTLKEPK